jgi:hypothetical protein
MHCIGNQAVVIICEATRGRVRLRYSWSIRPLSLTVPMVLTNLARPYADLLDFFSRHVYHMLCLDDNDNLF